MLSAGRASRPGPRDPPLHASLFLRTESRVMSRRFKMSGGSSRHLFTSRARGAHRKNFLPTSGFVGPMRGGIRL